MPERSSTDTMPTLISRSMYIRLGLRRNLPHIVGLVAMTWESLQVLEQAVDRQGRTASLASIPDYRLSAVANLTLMPRNGIA